MLIEQTVVRQIERHFYVVEVHQKTLDDYLVMGDYREITVGTVEHGPYESEAIAKRQLKLVAEQYGKKVNIKSLSITPFVTCYCPLRVCPSCKEIKISIIKKEEVKSSVTVEVLAVGT